MKTIDQNQLEKVTAAAEAFAQASPLKGQADVAVILQKKGFSVRAISRFLSDNGLPVSTTAISNYFRKEGITAPR